MRTDSSALLTSGVRVSHVPFCGGSDSKWSRGPASRSAGSARRLRAEPACTTAGVSALSGLRYVSRNCECMHRIVLVLTAFTPPPEDDGGWICSVVHGYGTGANRGCRPTNVAHENGLELDNDVGPDTWAGAAIRPTAYRGHPGRCRLRPGRQSLMFLVGTAGPRPQLAGVSTGTAVINTSHESSLITNAACFVGQAETSPGVRCYWHCRNRAHQA